MKKEYIVIIITGLILLMNVLAYAEEYTEVMISHELINRGSPTGWYADDGCWFYAFPFPFPFYGTEYRSAYVCSNGFINLNGVATSYRNSIDGLSESVRIAPLWDDFMTCLDGCNIYIYASDPDFFCIRWEVKEFYSRQFSQFELVLYRNGNIKFNYGQTGNNLTPTIGISKGDRSNYLISAHNGANSLSYTQSSLITSQTTNQSPTVSINAAPTTGNIPLQVSFTANGQDPDGTIVSYNWDFGDNSSSNVQNPTHTYNTTGSYSASVTVTDNEGLAASASITIVATAPTNQPPVISAAEANPSNGTVPLEVDFTAAASDTDGSITSYFWQFGDGQTSTLQNPTHTYNNQGTYNARLTVTDDDGAAAAAVITITVSETPATPAAIPKLIRFQGNLGDRGGSALNGTRTLTFRLYEVAAGGTPIWYETQQVNIEAGALDVKLGSVTELNLPFDKQYWLGVEVASDGEMSPRFELTAVPYSFKVKE